MSIITSDGQTMDDLRDGLENMLGGLKQMLAIQAAHGEMLRQILEAATAESDGDLGELLRRLVEHDEAHAKALAHVQGSIDRLPATLQRQAAG
jgi:hypothetical protein